MIIKQKPEDFIVEEVANRDFSSGELFVYKATKINLNTPEMCNLLAKANNLRSKQIGYAGMKDRLAITSQFISSPNELSTVEGVELELVGRTDTPIQLGDHGGNRFHIVVKTDRIVQDVKIPNYFGEQRFSHSNVKVGLLLLQKKFGEAAQLLAEQFDGVRKRLEKNPSAPVDAIQSAPTNILSIYIHAVQSYLFNEVVSTFIQEQCDTYTTYAYSEGTFRFPSELENEIVPVIGAVSELGKWEMYYQRLLEELEITQHDFIIRQLPHLSAEGTTRSLLSDVRELSYEKTEQGYVVEMFLGKSCYATIALKGLFSQSCKYS